LKVRGFGWLSVLTAVVKEVLTKPKLPPVPSCVICHRPNHWIVEGETYGCGFHTFSTAANQSPVDPLITKKYPPGKI
jgi:hypothetical protein